MELDKTDIGILNILLADSRLSYRQIAKKAGVSAATVLKRVKNMERNKVIRGYTCSLDYEAIGYDIPVMIEIRVSKGKLFEVEKKIANSHNVFAVYDQTGDFDATILARFKNRRAMDNFLKKIQTFEFVERTSTKLILNVVKEENMRIG